MARKTQQNKLTSASQMALVNPENLQLKKEFLTYLRSKQRADSSIASYENDLDIFFCWNLRENKNKSFIDLTKRDVIAFQNFLLYECKHSPARVRRIKAALSSLSKYIEDILDEEYPTYRSVILKVESPVNQAVRTKTIFREEELIDFLEVLVNQEKYLQACAVALAMCSGVRKAELPRFKVSFFDEENIIYGSLYKTPEPIRTKGRGKGKFIPKYVLVKPFQRYLDMWMEKRKELGITSEWLLVKKGKVSGEYEQLNVSALNGWTKPFTERLGKNFYWHSLRHFFTTYLARSGLPDSVIQGIVGWESAEMVKLYKDISVDDELGDYFEDGQIKSKKSTLLGGDGNGTGTA